MESKFFKIFFALLFITVAFSGQAQRREFSWEKSQKNGTPNTLAGWNASGVPAAMPMGITGSLTQWRIPYALNAGTLVDNDALKFFAGNHILVVGRNNGVNTFASITLTGSNSSGQTRESSLQSHVAAGLQTTSLQAGGSDLRLSTELNFNIILLPTSGNIIFKNLPITNPCATAPSGTIWNNSGILNICP